MPSTYTDSLRLEKQGIGENNNTWGGKLNTLIEGVDDAIAGTTDIAVSSGTTTLTTVNGGEDQSRYRILRLTGSLSANVVVQVPEVSKEYTIWDATTRNGFSITFRLGASGNTTVIPELTNTAYGISTNGTSWRPITPQTASVTQAGVVQLATTAEAQGGSNAVNALTPSTLQDVTATETRKGVIELATTSEAQAGSDGVRALTPSTLQDVTATATRRGVIELATQAEVDAGTDTSRAVVPDTLKGYVGDTTANMATSIRDGTFDPTSATLVWSGSATSVAMSSLSEQGPGFYIIKGTVNSRTALIYVADVSVDTFGSIMRRNATKDYIQLIYPAYASGNFSVANLTHWNNDAGLSENSTVSGIFEEIYKV